MCICLLDFLKQVIGVNAGFLYALYALCRRRVGFRSLAPA